MRLFRRDRSARWREAEFCVVDLELTGLDPRADDVISFAGIPVTGGAIRPGEGVEGLVRPTRPVPPETARIHGLLAGELAHAPEPPAALEPLFDLLEGRVLVAHFAWVERAFLDRELARAGRSRLGAAVDTAELAQRAGSPVQAPGGRASALGPLAAALGLPVHRPHTAAGDALTTAQVFVALATHLDSTAPQTLRTLTGTRARVGRPLDAPRGSGSAARRSAGPSVRLRRRSTKV